jgi:hypothetical protein
MLYVPVAYVTHFVLYLFMGTVTSFVGGLKFSGQFIIKLNIYGGLPAPPPPRNLQKVQCWNFITIYGGLGTE